MNKRIQELAEQADSYALATIGNLWIGWEEKNPGWEDCRDQKFAELIVRECRVALSPMLRDQISRGKAFDLIKQHFGVE